jgi:hypothetical protein
MIDFVSKLLRGKKGNDIIWVVVNWLTKSTLFLPMKMSALVVKLARLYIDEVIRLHKVPMSIFFFYQGPLIYFLNMVIYTMFFGNKFESKYSFSSFDWQTIREDYSDIGKPVEIMCVGI